MRSVYHRPVKISFASLFFAYRQAKNALHQEHASGRIALARSESKLQNILHRLQDHLRNPGWFSSIETGKKWVVPKKLRISRKENSVLDVSPTVTVGDGIDVRVHLEPSIEFAILEI